MSPGYGQARRQTAVLPIALAAVCGALAVVLAITVLQRHARPDLVRVGLVCYPTATPGDAGDGMMRAAMQIKPSLICEGIQK